MDTITAQARAAVATIEDVITGSESRRFYSSVLISLTEGATYDAAVGRAFRSLWSSRLGYASTLTDAAWSDLNFIAERLGVKL